MPETRKPMTNEEIAEFTRKAHHRAVARAASEMGRELIESRKQRQQAEKEAERKELAAAK